MSRYQEPAEAITVLTVGRRIRFDQCNGGARWWTVRALDDRFIVATRPAPFGSDEIFYTVVDLTGWAEMRYNGAGPGVVRSSINLLGGGYDVGPNGENADTLLAELQSGELELSRRRVCSVGGIEIEASR